MLEIIDTADRNTLYPFTAIRPVADLRIGICTNRERWELLLTSKTSVLTEPYLQKNDPEEKDDPFLYINAKLIPSVQLSEKIRSLSPGNGITSNGRIIALCSNQQLSFNFSNDDCTEVDCCTKQ